MTISEVIDGLSKEQDDMRSGIHTTKNIKNICTLAKELARHVESLQQSENERRVL